MAATDIKTTRAVADVENIGDAADSRTSGAVADNEPMMGAAAAADEKPEMKGPTRAVEAAGLEADWEVSSRTSPQRHRKVVGMPTS